MLFLKTLIISLICSSIGFKKAVYFFSVGYGLSIGSIALYLLIISKNLVLEEILLGVIYILYGYRLALFLFVREYKHLTYIKKMGKAIDKLDEIKFIGKIFMWISCALLFALQTTALTFRILNQGKSQDKSLFYFGFFLTFFGFILEIIADKQKTESKKINPNRFVDTGLYKYVRCPNYLGELILWTGSFISGIKIYNGSFQWIAADLGYICIIYVMFSGTRRIEINQNSHYSKNEEFKKYIKRTPILIPFIPLYSVEKYTWLKA